MKETYYEFFEGNNSPSSRLRRIDDLNTEEKKRAEKGYSFFELMQSPKNLGDICQRRDIEKARRNEQ